MTQRLKTAIWPFLLHVLETGQPSYRRERACPNGETTPSERLTCNHDLEGATSESFFDDLDRGVEFQKTPESSSVFILGTVWSCLSNRGVGASGELIRASVPVVDLVIQNGDLEYTLRGVTMWVRSIMQSTKAPKERQREREAERERCSERESERGRET